MKKLDPGGTILFIGGCALLSYLPIILTTWLHNPGWLFIYPMFIAAIMVYLRLTD